MPMIVAMYRQTDLNIKRISGANPRDRVNKVNIQSLSPPIIIDSATVVKHLLNLPQISDTT